jgi:methionyl-tRNA formyltransferase
MTLSTANRDMGRPRVAVFGYSEVGVRCLQVLIERGARVVAVFTHADDPGEVRWFGSVADLASQHHIPVRMPEDVGSAAVRAEIQGFAPDLIFSFYYRMMIPTEILDLARLGAFNMHGSLLPKYRGRAPVNWAVLYGEVETGATLHHMVARADAGDIVDQERVVILPEETAGEVSAKVADAACVVLARRFDELIEGRAPRVAQDASQASYFGRRDPEDGRIDWSGTARQVVNLVRAVTRPFPGAFTDGGGRRLYVWRVRPVRLADDGLPGTVLAQAPLIVATGDGAVELQDWSWGKANAPGGPPAIGTRLA